jgi:hypothetical protein
MDLMAFIWPIFFPLLGAIIALIHIRWKNLAGAEAVGNFLMWQLAIGFGLAYLYAGSGHLFLADKVAESIGWPTGSPFQTEVGMWDAAMGICGLLCLKFRNDFWTAVVIGPGIFMVSAGLGHVWQLVVHGDTAPNNAGAVMYIDLLYPLFLAALLIWYRRKLAAESTGTPGQMAA